MLIKIPFKKLGFEKWGIVKLILGVGLFTLMFSNTANSEEYIKLVKKDNSEIMIDISKLRVIKVTDITSVEKNDKINNLDITIYPNPTNEKVTIDLSKVDNLNLNEIKIKIYDSNQKLINNIDKIETSNIEIDLRNLNLSKGLYFIEITKNKSVLNLSKLIIE